MTTNTQADLQADHFCQPGLRLAICFLALGATTTPAAAYLDSDTGTLVLQIGFGVVAGVIVAAYMYRKEIPGLFRRSERDD